MRNTVGQMKHIALMRVELKRLFPHREPGFMVGDFKFGRNLIE